MLIERVDDITRWSKTHRDAGRRVALVPTQGALHEGHASLITAARATHDAVAVSVFVNPIQFSPKGYAEYPRSLEHDTSRALNAGADAVFAPGVDEIYPGAGNADALLSFTHAQHEDRDPHAFRADPFPGSLGDAYVRVPSDLVMKMDGVKHPWHFDGVATVVRRLHDLVQPHAAYYGEKDVQQLAIIRAMNDWLGSPTQIRGVPITRGEDGVALSSRHARLGDDERRVASKIARIGLEVSAETTIDEIRASLDRVDGARLDDVSLVDRVTLDPLARADRPAALYIAYFIGDTRLQECVILGTRSATT